VFPLYIEGAINVGKILREDSMVVINAMNLFEYITFNFINANSWCLFSVTVIFHFSNCWSLFWCVDFYKCVMHFLCYFSLVHNVFIFVTHMLCTYIFPFFAPSPLFLRTIFPSNFCIFYFFISFSFFFSFLFLFFIFLSYLIIYYTMYMSFLLNCNF
jgi:hypothetical protein